MSEPVTEPITDPEPELEPVGAPESDPELEPDGEPAEPIEGPEEDAEAAQDGDEHDAQAQAAMTEKALQVRDQKLDAENARHAKRVGDIMEEAAVDLIPCPVCMDGIAGWVYTPEAQELPEEAKLRLRQLLGLSGLEGLLQAKDAARCPDCDGNGEVKTDSRVPGYETKTCGTCGKKGWISVGGPATNGLTHPEGELVVTGPTVYAADNEDPEIAHLRERGFTVIPPMVVGQGA